MSAIVTGNAVVDKETGSSRFTQVDPIALEILRTRYFKQDEAGNVVEDIAGLFSRVAHNIAQAESLYSSSVHETQQIFLEHLRQGYFIPASPILMNAGNTLQHLFSDHALDVPDSLEDIFEVLKIAATIQQHGGGVGFSFSRIRPRNDDVSGMKNVAFGPLNVMKIFDTSFSAILQGGRRSGANMGILHISHPDVLAFIQAKKDPSVLQNFNLSVALTDDFMKAVEDDGPFNLINPRTQEVVQTVRAKELFEAIALHAWMTGDPGVVFIDEMNRNYPFTNKEVLCTGSCGQYELESFEGVPYAHINFVSLLKQNKQGKKYIDMALLKQVVHTTVRFLDNCIDMHKYPHNKFEKKCKQSRKIGLGVLGFAELLFELGISYGSSESLELIDELMSVISKEAHQASHQLALQRGSFLTHALTSYTRPMRNATITSIAPTGSTSIIAQTSQSIEPVYALSFTTTTKEGKEYTILNSAFKRAVDALPIDKTAKIQLQFADSLQNISWLDDDFKRVFKTAMDISPQQHLEVMARFQRYVDNSISKTINLPHSATVSDIAGLIRQAHKLHCKGVTLYRDGCRSDQALSSKTQTRLSAFEEE